MDGAGDPNTGEQGKQLTNDDKMAIMLARMQNRQTAISKKSTVSGHRDELIKKLDKEFYDPLLRLKTDAQMRGVSDPETLVCTSGAAGFGHLQQVLAEYAMSIPSYELKRAQKALKEVQDLYATPADIPKREAATEVAGVVQSRPTATKLFSFARSNDAVAEPIETVLPSPTKPNKTLFANGSAESGQLQPTSVRDDSLITGKTNEDIVLSVEHSGKDLRLIDLTGCTILIPEPAASLQIRNLTACKIIAVPASTSIMLEDCKDCVFVIGCQQLRVHTTVACDFYLFATSNPVIEDCMSVRFAPYSVGSVPLSAGTANQWDQVKDFNWLVASTPSPNWSIIPESERVSFSL